MPPPLTPAERLLFKAIKRAAVVLLLFLRLDCPLGEQEIARELSIDRETVRNYLRDLSDAGFLTRTGRYQGYVLTQDGRQIALPASFSGAMAEKPRSMTVFAPSAAAPTPDSMQDSMNLLTVVVGAGERGIPATDGGKAAHDDGFCAIPKSRADACGKPVDKFARAVEKLIAARPEKAALLAALGAAGIAINARTFKLLQSDLSPEEVRAQQRCLIERGKGSQTGLLITVLESQYRPQASEPQQAAQADRQRYALWEVGWGEFAEEAGDQAIDQGIVLG